MHSIAAGARHHMNMQMRDALVDRVIDSDEAAAGTEGGHSRTHRADLGEERRNEFGR